MSENEQKTIAPAEVVKKVTTAEPVIEKKITISVDNTPEQVLSFDQDGCTLFFDDTPGRFLDLPPAAFKELSARNRAAYSVSYTLHQKLLEEQETPPSGITVVGGASATQQLRVEDPRKGIHKSWNRPDQVSSFKAGGYKVTNDPRVKTFGSSVGTTHTVGQHGSAELILLETSEEAYQASQQALADKAVGKSRAIDEGTQAALEAMGGKMDPRFKATAFTPRKKEVIRKAR